jgi:hypothetical protein
MVFIVKGANRSSIALCSNRINLKLELKDVRLGIAQFRVLVVNSLHFMKKLIYHESTKFGKHEIFLSCFSCFLHFVLS